MHLEFSALGICRIGQSLVGIMTLLIERVIRIIGPDAYDFTRSGEAGNIIDMSGRLFRIDAVLDPDHLVDREIVMYLLFDLFFCKMRISAR